LPSHFATPTDLMDLLEHLEVQSQRPLFHRAKPSSKVTKTDALILHTPQESGFHLPIGPTTRAAKTTMLMDLTVITSTEADTESLSVFAQGEPESEIASQPCHGVSPRATPARLRRDSDGLL